jgi:hypothetical protein
LLAVSYQEMMFIPKGIRQMVGDTNDAVQSSVQRKVQMR